MKPKLYLHVGTHKTGTSAIQDFFGSNRAELERLGYFYPCDPLAKELGKGDSHHGFSLGLASKQREPRKLCELTVSEWHRHAKKENVSVVLSSEAIFRLQIRNNDSRYQEGRDNYINKLRDLLKNFDVVPVMVVRRPDNYLSSLYSEHVSTGLKNEPESLSSFAKSEKISSLMDYKFFKNLLSENFGKVKVISYEELSHSKLGLVKAFLSNAIGLNEYESFKLKSTTVRKSLSIPELRVKELLNGRCNSRKEKRILKKVISKSDLIAKIISALYGESSFTLWENSTERLHVLSEHSDSLDFWKSKTDASIVNMYDKDVNSSKKYLAPLTKEEFLEAFVQVELSSF